MESDKYELSKTDWRKWAINVALFASPVALIYLGTVQGNINNDGFQWTDFQTNQFVIGSMITYVVSSAIDLIKKYVSGK